MDPGSAAQQSQLPWWVRFVVPAGGKRREAFSRHYYIIFQIGLALYILCISDHTTLLGRIGFVLLLISLCVSVALIVWIWVAIRWMDRRKLWP
jgi:hypothetical protein